MLSVPAAIEKDVLRHSYSHAESGELQLMLRRRRCLTITLSHAEELARIEFFHV